MNDETIGAIKKHWPWALAIVAGGYLLFYRSSSSASADTVSTASQIAAPDYTALAQMGMQTQIAQIAADASETAAMFGAISSLGQSTAQMNSDFLQAQVASYDSARAVNVAAIQGATAIAATGISAASEIQRSFNTNVTAMSVAGVGATPQKKGSNAAANAGKVASIVGAFFSDRRLKRNIELIEFCPEIGVNIYEFDYIGSDAGRYRGVMADEVLRVRPDAVTMDDFGYMMVDYGALGLKMVRV